MVKLIHKTTNKEHLCEKVHTGGFDYYVSDEILKKNDWCIKNNFLNKVIRIDSLSTIEDWIKAGWKK